jgi:hypothetical protein
LERSIAVRQGLHFLRSELPGILAKRTERASESGRISLLPTTSIC